VYLVVWGDGGGIEANKADAADFRKLLDIKIEYL